MASLSKKKKPKKKFVCRECGHQAAQWLGKCSGCSEWNTLEEITEEAPSAQSSGRRAEGSALPLSEISADAVQRFPSGISELDRVLGGGMVAGGVTLLGGDPGIGKSTLLMQTLAALAAKGHDTLYVTGEESAAQIALRGRRLASPGIMDVRVLATTDLEDVEKEFKKSVPAIVVIDSIQTLRSRELSSAPGSVSQLREVAVRLIDLAKRLSTGMFLIGHVTKEGALAGPKVLEHLVDTVLSFEGEQGHTFRLLRTAKNRFGPAHEVGVFEMVKEGLREVPDPSALFLAERPDQAPGSVVTPTSEGTRPVLVEIQALVAKATYGSARRVVSGVDSSRLAILLAVLERNARIQFAEQDVFASAAGGARVAERSVDLAMALAVVSSLKSKPIHQMTAAFGEVGLAGELRAVPKAALRVAEAKKLGFERVIMPFGNATKLTKQEKKGIDVVGSKTLRDALIAAFS